VMAGRVVRASLYEIGSADPMTLIFSALVLSAVSLSACYLPARRAARIDPMVALQCE
jgi:ABC-type lipoprotein release transport system permease subunit